MLLEPKEVKSYKISDIARVVTGSTPSKNNPEHWGNSVPFLTPSDQQYGVRTPETDRYLSDEGADSFERRMIPAGSTALTCIGATIGKISLVKQPTVTNQQINSLITKSGTDSLYLYYKMTTCKEDLVAMASGSATPIVSKKLLESLEINLPNLEYQEYVAEILGSLDDKIEANNALLSSLDEYLRLDYVALTKQGKDMRTVSDIASEVRDGASAEEIDESDVYVGLEHLPRRNVWLSSWGNGSDVTSNKSRFKKGDILFGKLRPYFHKVVVAPVDGVCSTDIIVVRPKPGFEQLALQVLSSDAVIEHATNVSNGTRMPRAKWSDLKGYEFAAAENAKILDLDLATSLINENKALAETRDLLIRKLIK